MLRQVKTENGWVRGIEAADPRITAFKGIPFAAPPTGKNRWRAPQPCENWAGADGKEPLARTAALRELGGGPRLLPLRADLHAVDPGPGR